VLPQYGCIRTLRKKGCSKKKANGQKSESVQNTTESKQLTQQIYNARTTNPLESQEGNCNRDSSDEHAWGKAACSVLGTRGGSSGRSSGSTIGTSSRVVSSGGGGGISVGSEAGDIGGDGEGVGAREIDGTISLVDSRVGSQESTGVESVLGNNLVGPGRELSEIDVVTPAGSTVVAVGIGQVVGVGHGGGEDAGVGNKVTHGATDGSGGLEVAGGVDDTEHTLVTVSWGTAEVEDGGGVVDNLVENEALVLGIGGEGSLSGGVTEQELARLGHGVVIGIPLELDGVTDGCIDHEWHVTENTLGGSNDDGVGDTVGTSLSTALAGTASAGGGRSVHGRGGREGGQALVHAVSVV